MGYVERNFHSLDAYNKHKVVEMYLSGVPKNIICDKFKDYTHENIKDEVDKILAPVIKHHHDAVKMIDVLERIRTLTTFDKKPLIEKALKLCKECGEAAAAVLSYSKSHGCVYKNNTAEDVLEELCDVFIMSLSNVFMLHPNISIEDVSKVINMNLDKWAEKINNNM